MSQKSIFLNGEADQWNFRNPSSSAESLHRDFLSPSLEKLPLPPNKNTHVLEIGCGQGARIKSLSSSFNWTVTGIDPSQFAIEKLNSEGINAITGTADKLPFNDSSFDLLIFGFCLYLCDTSDLFKITAEAHRVLKSSAWIAILDFWHPHVKYNPYSYVEGVYSRKQNYGSMFSWHPDYTITDYSLRDHSDFSFTDNSDEWIASTIIRKKSLP